MSLSTERGSQMMEFALVLPLLVALLMGIITIGLALNRSNSLRNGAREAARFAATLPVETTLSNWLNDVADVAIGSATGELDDGGDGRFVCVAYVYPDGTEAQDQTVRMEVDQSGVRTLISDGKGCFSDGRPNDERRTHVWVERDADIMVIFFNRTVTLTGRSAARFERTI